MPERNLTKSEVRALELQYQTVFRVPAPASIEEVLEKLQIEHSLVRQGASGEIVVTAPDSSFKLIQNMTASISKQQGEAAQIARFTDFEVPRGTHTPISAKNPFLTELSDEIAHIKTLGDAGHAEREIDQLITRLEHTETHVVLESKDYRGFQQKIADLVDWIRTTKTDKSQTSIAVTQERGLNRIKTTLTRNILEMNRSGGPEMPPSSGLKF